MPQETSFPKNKIKILLLEGVHPSAVNYFTSAGYENIEQHGKTFSEEELSEKIKDVHILGIRSKTKLTQKVFANADKLIAAGCFCIGTNQVDMNSATEKGIAVFNSPFSNTRSVAELVIAETIMLLRRIGDMNTNTHLGKWSKSSSNSFEARGKTLGIVGYGHIGSQVSVLAEGLGFSVLFYDVEPKLSHGNARQAKNLDELYSKSDVITLHAPGGKSTANMINAVSLSKMKKGVLLINLSRGDLMDTDAVKVALETKQLGGLGLDVYLNEPKTNSEPFSSPFQNMPNVVLTPHIGGSTVEAQENIGIEVAEKLISFLDTGSSVSSLSIPSLSLPVQEDAHRLLHIHENIPGVLSEINGLLSEMNVNILGQYLKTNPKIGYVVLDIDKKTSTQVIDELKKVKNTIRVRSLY